MITVNKQEKQRVTGRLFIPLPNEHLQNFARINKDEVVKSRIYHVLGFKI